MRRRTVVTSACLSIFARPWLAGGAPGFYCFAPMKTPTDNFNNVLAKTPMVMARAGAAIDNCVPASLAMETTRASTSVRPRTAADKKMPVSPHIPCAQRTYQARREEFSSTAGSLRQVHRCLPQRTSARSFRHAISCRDLSAIAAHQPRPARHRLSVPRPNHCGYALRPHLSGQE